MAFSMARTWDDSIALARERLADLLLVSVAVHVIAVLVALPMLAQWFELARSAGTAADPQVELQRAMETMQSVMGLSILANLLQLVGYATMVVLLGPDRPTLGRAIVLALKATPTLFISIVFLIVGFYLAMIVVMLALVAVIMAIAGAAALSQGEPSAAAAAPLMLLFMILYLGLFAGLLYFMLRFVTLLPVVTIERKYNPFTALDRSWSLTRRRGWRIVGFWLLIWIPLMVVYGALVVALMPSILSSDGTGPIGIDVVPLFAAVMPLNIALGMFLSAVVVATHRQLAEEPGEL